MFVMIESSDKRGDDMDDVFLDLDQIKDTTMSTESSKKRKLVEDSENYPPTLLSRSCDHVLACPFWSLCVFVFLFRMLPSPIFPWFRTMLRYFNLPIVLFIRGEWSSVFSFYVHSFSESSMYAIFPLPPFCKCSSAYGYFLCCTY